MARWPKPPEGSWTEHFELGTEPMNYEDSISEEFFELEREAVFKRAWLNVGRVEQLPRTGSYFTKELAVAKTSVVVVKGKDGEVRAFYNMCRHRGNKLVWNDYPKEETSGTTRQFVCKYHAWRYDLDGACSFVQQEQEFFDLDKADYGLVPVHCDIWAGFIFINLAKEPEQSLRDFLGPHGDEAGELPVRAAERALLLPRQRQEQLEALHGRLPGVLPRTDPPREAVTTGLVHRGGRRRGSRRPPTNRRAAPVGEHGRHPPVGPGGEHGQAHRHADPQRALRALGRARPRLRPEEGRHQPGRLRPVGSRLVPTLAELHHSRLAAGLVPHVPLLARRAQRARVRGDAVLRPGQDGPRAGGARERRRHLQGVRAPGRQHAGGDADDARVTRDRALPPDGPGGAVPPHAQGGPGVGGRLQEAAAREV